MPPRILRNFDKCQAFSKFLSPPNSSRNIGDTTLPFASGSRLPIGRALDLGFTGRGFESWLGTIVYCVRSGHGQANHTCVPVIKQYNLVPAKG